LRAIAGSRRSAPIAAIVYVTRMDEPLLDALSRMVSCSTRRKTYKGAGPTVQREINYPRTAAVKLGQRLVRSAEWRWRNHRIVPASIYLSCAMRRRYGSRKAGRIGAHESLRATSPLQGGYRDVAAAIPKHLRLPRGERLMCTDGSECPPRVSGRY